jgi:ubiquinone/menaquinone biosynthesis C-methylase UbiE
VSVDVQPGMVRVLAGQLRRGRAERARPIVGDATQLPLADRSVDAAFLSFVLGELPDRPAALAELRRVIKPGGVLSVMETLTDCDYQLEASVVDLCRAFGFIELDRWTQPLGYARCFTAPAGRPA